MTAETWLNISLSVASISLGCVAVIVALAAILAYFEIKSKAERIAGNVAREIAEKVAEETTNNYVQKNILDIIIAHQEVLKNAVEVVDEIAGSQESKEI